MDPYEKAKNTRTDLQSVTAPFIPADAEVMTVRIEYPPGDPGVPPHRHPGGPCFGYILEGEMVFEVRRANRREWSRPARHSGNPAGTSSTIRTPTTAPTSRCGSSSP